MNIAVVNTKGGVGKTTTSMLLAAAATRAGHEVRVLDGDPQSSATDWSLQVGDDGDELPFDVIVANVSTIKRAGNKEGVTVIDTPPGTPVVIDAAIDVADLVIVPTAASPGDISRVWQTLETTAHRPTAVLLTSVLPNAKLNREIRDALSDQDVAVFDTEIPRREGIKLTYGYVPEDLYGYDDLWAEIVKEVGLR